MAIEGARPDHRRIAPHLIVPDTDEAVDFYRRAFGAEVLYLSPLPNGKHLHANLRIADSIVMLTQESPSDDGHSSAGTRVASPQRLGGTTVLFELYVDDVDAAVARAVAEGAAVRLPVDDMFWGDRYGWVQDPFGFIWALATIKEVLSPKQVEDRMIAAFGSR